MKHLIIFILFWILLCLTTKGQSKKPIDTKDLSYGKEDSAVKVDTSYAVILSKSEFDWFISIIEKQDEKPSIIAQQKQAIRQRTQFILPPKKEEVKKK